MDSGPGRQGPSLKPHRGDTKLGLPPGAAPPALAHRDSAHTPDGLAALAHRSLGSSAPFPHPRPWCPCGPAHARTRVCTHGYPSSPHACPVPRPSGATRPPAHPSGLSATSGRAPGALSWTVEGWPSLPILTGGKALPAPHRGWAVGSRLRGPGRRVRKGCHGGQVQPEVSSCGQGKDCLQGTKCWEPNQRTPPVSLSTSCWDAHAPGPRVIVTFRGPGSLSAHSTHIYLVPIVCQGLFLEPGSEALPSG